MKNKTLPQVDRLTSETPSEDSTNSSRPAKAGRDGKKARPKKKARESLLSGQTRDDTDASWGEHSGRKSDAEYDEERPPHW